MRRHQCTLGTCPPHAHPAQPRSRERDPPKRRRRALPPQPYCSGRRKSKANRCCGSKGLWRVLSNPLHRPTTQHQPKGRGHHTRGGKETHLTWRWNRSSHFSLRVGERPSATLPALPPGKKEPRSTSGIAFRARDPSIVQSPKGGPFPPLAKKVFKIGSADPKARDFTTDPPSRSRRQHQGGQRGTKVRC